MKLAQTLCRLIGIGAVGTGLVMVLFSRSVEATSRNAITDAIVHVSNAKFMAAMWCVVGVMFLVGAAHLHETGTWRLLKLGCMGITVSAIVRLVEMARLSDFSGYGVAAAVAEVTFPPCLIYLRRQALTGVQA